MHWRRKWQPTPVFLPWRISGTEEPGGLPSMRSHRVGHDWSDLAAAAGNLKQINNGYKLNSWGYGKSKNHSPWLILCQIYLRMYALGQCLVEFTILRYPFYLFLAASWEVCKASLKSVRQVLSCPLPVPLVGSFLYPRYFNKIYTKLWITEIIFGPRVKSSPLETTNSAPNTVSYHIACMREILQGWQSRSKISKSYTICFF